MAHISNPTTLVADTGWWKVWDQPGLPGKSLYQKQNQPSLMVLTQLISDGAKFHQKTLSKEEEEEEEEEEQEEEEEEEEEKGEIEVVLKELVRLGRILLK